MSEHLSRAEQLRCVALEAASRAVQPGTATSGLLSRAYQCETYLATGLVRTGPAWLAAAEVGYEGVSVLVEAERLSETMAARVREAVRALVPAKPSAGRSLYGGMS